MKKVVILFVLLCLGIGGSLYYQYWEKLLLQDQRDHLTLYGNVEIRRVNLGFRVPGRISAIHFEEGDKIKKGETIAMLDQEPYKDNLAVAEAQVKRAEVEYGRLQAGMRPQEIEQAKATLNERNATLKVLESDNKRAKQLVLDKVVSEQEYETVVARRDEAIARKKQAEETLNLLVEGYRQEDVAAGKAALSEANANLKRMQTALSDATLTSPSDGILLTRVEEPGAVVREGQIIATLSLKNDVWIYIYIPERELGNIARGQKVEIYTDSRPNQPYTGQIGSISPEAEFTPKTVETTELRTSLVFRVRVIADNPDEGLKQGMPVTVHVKRTVQIFR